MASKFRKLRSVTLGVLKLAKGQPRALYIHGPMHIGEKMKNSTMGPATLMHAVDLETGEEGVVLVPTIMRNELQKQYPGESYVGKSFEVVITRDTEKKYNHVGIDEIDPGEDFKRPTTPPRTGPSVSALDSATQARLDDAGQDDGDGDGDGEGAAPTPAPTAAPKPQGKSKR